jgi:hypothetical protein
MKKRRCKSMSKGGAKAQRRAKALKKARVKKLLIILACILAIAAIAALAVLSNIRNADIEIFREGTQQLRLLPDGTFTYFKSQASQTGGTYEKANVDGRTQVAFTVRGSVGLGWIDGNALTLPTEWDDGCGHSNVLRKTK